MKITFTFLLGALFMFSLTFGQSRLNGTIRNELGEPVTGASVFIQELKKGILTGNDGTWTLEVVPQQDSVTLTVTMFEYNTVSQRIVLKPGITTYNFTLQPLESSTEDVVITASRHEQKLEEVPVSMIVLKQKQVDIQGSNDIVNVLEQVPGVSILDDQLSIRGSSGYSYGVGSRVMVCLNGLPLLTADATAAIYDLIPMDNIRQIEVIKGASSVLYGSSALGGVINILTSEPGDKPVTLIRSNSSIFDKPRNKILDWDGNSSAWIQGMHIFHSRNIGPVSMVLQLDGVKNTGYRMGTDTEQFRVLTMLGYRPKNLSQLFIGLNAGAQVDSNGTYLYWKGYYPDTSIYTVGSRRDTVVRGGALTPDPSGVRKQMQYRINIDPTISWLFENPSILLTWRSRWSTFQNQNSTQQEANGRLFYHELVANMSLWKERITWTSGMSVIPSRCWSDSLYGEHNGMQTGVFTQGNLSLGRVTGSLGVRYQYNTIDKGKVSSGLLKSVGVNVRLLKATFLRASYGEGLRSPSPAERFTNTSAGLINIKPNVSIRDESGYSIEGGIRQLLGFGNVKGYLDAAIFRMDFNDMIEFETNWGAFPPTFSTNNFSHARIEGYEIGMGLNWKWKDLTVEGMAGYTYTDPRDLLFKPDSLRKFDDPKTWKPGFKDRPEFLKYRSQHMGRATVSIGYRKWSFSTNFRYLSKIENIDQFLLLVIQDLRTYMPQHQTGYRVYDFILGYDFGQTALSLHVMNALNEEYMTIPGTLGEQRRFTLQWKVQF